jgi:hypothetical protein
MGVMAAVGAALDAGLPAVLGGRYRISRRIGQGSLAQVVEALDETSGATVALKILYPNLACNPTIAERFKREAQIVRRIAHPHVIALHDVVESDGLTFLVMDVHRGGDLADRLARSGPLPGPVLRELGRQLCGALDAAHRAGVVHRDVKPQNVLVGPDPDALDTRLCDFGLARTADLAGLTTRSTVLGTPEYMAPEVISDGYADPRSDIYSLGVVLYEAATGRLPFRASSPFQLLRKHLTETPPRARAARPDLPPDIDEAIDRALCKEPLDRFASAADFAAAMAPRAPGAAVALAPRPSRRTALPTRATCRRCGGEVLRLAQTCVDCGARSLRANSVPGGYTVLVTGPGRIADKLDGPSHVALVRLLDELPPERANLRRLRKKPPRFPFFVLGDLDELSAGELCARLRELGAEARVERRPSFRPPEIRRKVRTMAGRYFGVTLFVGLAANNLLNGLLVDRNIYSPIFTFTGALLGVLGISVSLSASSSRRPVARLDAAAGAAPTLTHLAAWLPRLKRRADRRLLARLIDRLQLAFELGGRDAAELLAGRAGLACRGLAAVEERSRASEVVGPEPTARPPDATGATLGDALGAVREAERLRGVLLADLLRSFGRAEELCVRLARIEGLAAGEQAAALARELSDLSAEIEAEEDVAALLS